MTAQCGRFEVTREEDRKDAPVEAWQRRFDAPVNHRLRETVALMDYERIKFFNHVPQKQFESGVFHQLSRKNYT